MDKRFEAQLKRLIEQLPPNLQGQASRDIQTVLQAHLDSYEALLNAVTDRKVEASIRSIVCWLLARIGNRQCIPYLIEAFKDEETSVREAAIQAIAGIGDNSELVIQSLCEVLFHDQDAEVRKAAAYALGSLGGQRAAKSLVRVLQNQNEDNSVRGMAAESLSGIGGAGVVLPLEQALADSAAEVRFWAAFALGEIGDTRAIPELQKLANADTAILNGWRTVSQEASEAIANIRRKSDSKTSSE